MLAYKFRIYPPESMISQILSTQKRVLVQEEETQNKTLQTVGEMGVSQKLRFVWNICLRQRLDALAANYRSLIDQQTKSQPSCERIRTRRLATESVKRRTDEEKIAAAEAGRLRAAERKARKKAGLPPLRNEPPAVNPCPASDLPHFSEGEVCGLGLLGQQKVWQEKADCAAKKQAAKAEKLALAGKKEGKKRLVVPGNTACYDPAPGEGWYNGKQPVYLSDQDQLKDLRAFIATPEGSFLGDLKSFTRDDVVGHLHKAWAARFQGIAGKPQFKSPQDSMSLYYTGKPEECPSAKAQEAKRAERAALALAQGKAPRAAGEPRKLWHRLGPAMKDFRVRGCREFYFPGLGVLPLRADRPLPSNPSSVRITQHGTEWYAVFLSDAPKPARSGPPVVTVRQAVGIDRGVVNAMVDSTGEAFKGAEGLDDIEARIANLQRKAAIKDKGSKNWRAVQDRIGKLHQKATRIKDHAAHDACNKIVAKADFIVFEDLKLQNMMASAKGTVEEPGSNVAQKTGLNRSLSQAAMGRYREFVTYKVEATGGRTTVVNPKGTSQKCSVCGYTHPDNRPSQAVFKCLSCGHEANADVNAARNILALGMAKLLSGEVEEEYRDKSKQITQRTERKARMVASARMTKEERAEAKKVKETTEPGV